MKNSQRLQEASAIGRATNILEQMNTRLATGGRNLAVRQLSDWQSLRVICEQQIAKGSQGVLEVGVVPPDPDLLNFKNA